MAEKFYIVNPTQHALQIYDIIRIVPGSEDEPSITECTITSDAELQAIQGTEAWGLKVLSLAEYEEILATVNDEDEDEDDLPPPPPPKVKVSTHKSKSKTLVDPEIEPLDILELVE